MERLGVAIIGLNGAVSSTVIAGVQLMLKKVVPAYGMLTEACEPMGKKGSLAEILDFVPMEGLVFGGWDLHQGNVYDAAVHHKVFQAHQLEAVKKDLEALRPWPAVFSRTYAENIDGEHVVRGPSYREHIEAIKRDLINFKQSQKLDRVVVVNLASTEKYIDVGPVHETLEAFEKGIDKNDPDISPIMRYFYAANSLGIPNVNFTPSLANVPALCEHAEKNGVPFAGMDGKTGQTLVKTVLGTMFRARRLKIDGWYSTNFLGNNDGKVLDSPASNKTKIKSKAAVLDSIVGYKVDNHQVHIHYYKPRGDAKEAWDNIDMIGFAGVPMQMKVNFLCQDSILAAPLVIDMVRIIDVAHQKGAFGIQRQMSMFFKSPYADPGEQPEHDLFKQEAMLFGWAHHVAETGRAPEADKPAAQKAGSNGNGNGKSAKKGKNGKAPHAEDSEGGGTRAGVPAARLT